MPRKYNSPAKTGKRILLIDDDSEYAAAMSRLLEGEGHKVSCELNGFDALANLRQNFYDLLLIDYYMPGMTGEELIGNIRKFNSIVQIILQTGYANEQPPRELMKRLDIQGYFNKSEGPEKLLLWVDVGLKAASTLQLLHRSKEGLNYILNATPDMHRMRSLEELLQGILIQISGLLGVGDAFLAVLPFKGDEATRNPPEGFVATIGEDSELVIQAGTGKFQGRSDIRDYLDRSSYEAILRALESNKVQTDGASNIVPLVVGDGRIGVIYLDSRIDDRANMELLSVFANQAAVAIHNTQLYRLATFDPLTKVFLRGMFMNAFIRELRVAYRSLEPLCLLMIDVNGMKAINDKLGHLAGDQALGLVGAAIAYATRSTDIRGRIGGDEFAVVLANSGDEGARIVAGRIHSFLEGKSVESDKGSLAVSCSIGACGLSGSSVADIKPETPIENIYFQFMCRKMIRSADESLYESKRSKGSLRSVPPSPMAWVPCEAAKREFREEDYKVV